MSLWSKSNTLQGEPCEAASLMTHPGPAEPHTPSLIRLSPVLAQLRASSVPGPLP